MHPEVSGRDCESCNKYRYEESGLLKQNIETGQPVPRSVGSALPCQTRTGCPKGTPEDQRDFSRKNEEAYAHYMECKAIGVFPDDAIVRGNAGAFRNAEELGERIAQWELKQHFKMQAELMAKVLLSR